MRASVTVKVRNVKCVKSVCVCVSWFVRVCVCVCVVSLAFIALTIALTHSTTLSLSTQMLSALQPTPPASPLGPAVGAC